MLSVLLEYEEPDLAVLESGSQRFLGVVSDADSHIRRWIMSPLRASDLDYLSSPHGDVRSLFLDRETFVVDFDGTRSPVSEWSLEVGAAGDRNIPKPGLVLPLEQRRSLLPDWRQLESFP